jgi:pyruvate dehydrogenase E2 component (dihydrolipoamide acetyltransferase)
VLRGKDENVPADYAPKGKAAPVAAAAPAVAAPVVVAAPVAVPVVHVAPEVRPVIHVLQAAAPVHAGGRVAASPLARRLAASKGVDVSAVAGSGPKGRVVVADIAAAQPGLSRGGAIVRRGDTVQKLTPMRKSIASRLTQSKQTVPHFYVTMAVRMDALLDVRTQLNTLLAAQQVKVSVNDFIIKASALALRDFPAANAAWNGDSVVLFGNVDVSVAVSLDGGLITPIVTNADQKSLAAISTEMKQLAADARAGKLKPAQYEGGGFSVSNLGMYGVDQFAAIVNPPQAAILACGAAKETVVVEDGEMFSAQVMTMTLSVDHRVIDGALGAELAGKIKYYLETPVALVL